MTIFVLAAGEGTRLRPLTNEKPKCLVEVENKPILNWQIDIFNSLGFNEINVITGYKAACVDDPRINKVINPRYQSTNMVYSLFCAADLFPDNDDIIISYGDIVFEKSVIEKLILAKSDVSLVIDKNWKQYWASRMDEPLSDLETLKITETDKIIEIGKKPKKYDDIEGQYVGLIKVRANKIRDLFNAYNRMDKNTEYDGRNFDNLFMTSFLQHLIENNWDVRAVFIENGWAEVDTPSDINVVSKFCNLGS